MTALCAADIADRLESEPHGVELLSALGPKLYPEIWNTSPDGLALYVKFSRTLNAQGQPAAALNLARQGLAYYGDSIELRFQVALAHARGGNRSMAEQALAELLEPDLKRNLPELRVLPELQKQAYALRGRLFKDAAFVEYDPAARSELARSAALWYGKASACDPRDAFPRLNSATLLRIGGQTEASRRAGEIIYGLLVDRSPELEVEDGWREASLAESALLAQDIPRAIAHYEATVEQMLHARRLGDLISVFKNLRLLAQAGAIEEPASLRARLGSVVVFSGHRIDPLDWPTLRIPPRFPNDPEFIKRVQIAIRERLAHLNARFGFCSLASGADILFAEEMLARSAELDVVLPFQRDDFVRHCVDYGQTTDPQMQIWRTRFESILKQITAARIHYATEEPYLGADVLYDYANKFLQGLAKVRAGQCLLEPQALVLIDEQALGQTGGARSFEESWRGAGYEVDRINLADLRPSRGLHVPAPRPMPVKQLPKLSREVRAMLFADVAGFSHLREELAPEFFLQFPRVIADVIEHYRAQILTSNTWGDGFFAVLESASACARFALELVRSVGDRIAWKDWGFPESNPLRVGVHAGPVFVIDFDPVLKRRSFCGQHINRTARIEPVTLPGCVFGSEQFAALLTMAAGDEFHCDLIGTEQLAKKYATAALYRISSSACSKF